MPRLERIQIDTAFCSGKPVIRGTRILVASIISQVAAGESTKSILSGFPGLTVQDVEAAIKFDRESRAAATPAGGGESAPPDGASD